MTNQEINEFLAERLFSYKVEKVTSAVKILHDDGYNCGIGKLIKLNDDYYVPISNYISNWEQVIESIIKRETLVLFTAFYHNQSGEYFVEFNDVRAGGYKHNARDKSLGLAVCRAAVEYLKSQ